MGEKLIHSLSNEKNNKIYLFNKSLDKTRDYFLDEKTLITDIIDIQNEENLIKTKEIVKSVEEKELKIVIFLNIKEDNYINNLISNEDSNIFSKIIGFIQNFEELNPNVYIIYNKNFPKKADFLSTSKSILSKNYPENKARYLELMDYLTFYLKKKEIAHTFIDKPNEDIEFSLLINTLSKQTIEKPIISSDTFLIYPYYNQNIFQKPIRHYLYYIVIGIGLKLIAKRMYKRFKII
jgi:hypothetical protein